MEATKLTNGGRLLALGRRYDYEDSRTTNRLQTANKILADLGAEYVANHDDDSHDRHPEGRNLNGSPSSNGCTDRCKFGWSGRFLSNEIFNMAYALADQKIRNNARTVRNAG